MRTRTPLKAVTLYALAVACLLTGAYGHRMLSFSAFDELIGPVGVAGTWLFAGGGLVESLRMPKAALGRSALLLVGVCFLAWLVVSTTMYFSGIGG